MAEDAKVTSPLLEAIDEEWAKLRDPATFNLQKLALIALFHFIGTRELIVTKEFLLKVAHEFAPDNPALQIGDARGDHIRVQIVSQAHAIKAAADALDAVRRVQISTAGEQLVEVEKEKLH